LELNDIARRSCWWQSPVEARRDAVRFGAQVMAIGTDRDVEARDYLDVHALLAAGERTGTTNGVA
jgi:hypothetical protein